MSKILWSLTAILLCFVQSPLWAQQLKPSDADRAPASTSSSSTDTPLVRHVQYPGAKDEGDLKVLKVLPPAQVKRNAYYLQMVVRKEMAKAGDKATPPDDGNDE